MATIQPDAFDLIVIGTGLEESLIAAAAAKSGKTVLHLDQAENYGSAWSSLTLDQFLAWTERQAGCESLSPAEQQAAPQDTAASNAQDLVHVPVPHQQAALYSNVQLHRQHVELGSSREFSLDLAGKVVFCASETIDTMLAFGVQNYLEFKLFQGSYVYSDGKLVSVPASRAAVFRDRSLGPMDKRLLTRFLMQLGSSLHDNPFPQASPDQPLVSLLRSQGLSLLMQQFILDAVAMADSDQESLVPSHSAPAKQQLPAVDQHQPGSASASTSSSPSSSASPAAAVSQPVSGLATQPGTPSDTPSASASEHQSSAEATCADASPSSSAGVVSIEQGVKALRQYLSSVGRYGPSSGAFLTPMYGCAELPQAFCRVAAVHGAVYVLRQPITSLLLDPETEQCWGIQTNAGQVVKCSALAASADAVQNLPKLSQQASHGFSSQQQPQRQQQTLPAAVTRLSKAICILDGPIQDGESQLLIIFPPNTESLQNPHAIRAVQLGPATATCPGNRHLLYFSTPSTAPAAAEDLSHAVSALVRTDKAFARTTPTATSAAAPLAALSSQSQAQVSRDERPEALLVAFYNQQCQQNVDDDDTLPPNVACCLPPDETVDVDSAVRHAKEAFRKLYRDAPSAFEPAATGNDGDAESDDEALDALGDVLQSLGST